MDFADGRILLVDDDAALLAVIERYLSRLGYRVDACRSATDAWALIEANPSCYSGALVDLNMPGMGGNELAQRILESDASIRLVVMSGYPAGLPETALDDGRVGFLAKPFAPKELAQLLAATL